MVDKDGSESPDCDGKLVLRPITRPEVAKRFKVLEYSSCSIWKRGQDKILGSKKGSRYVTVAIEASFRCGSRYWPMLERGVWEAFLKQHDKRKIV